MRYLLLIIITRSVFCSEITVSNDDIKKYVDQYNLIAKETNHKIAIPKFLDITHPDSPQVFRYKLILSKDIVPYPFKIGNNELIKSFQIIHAGIDKAAVLIEEENGKTKIAVFRRDDNDKGVVKYIHELKY